MDKLKALAAWLGQPGTRGYLYRLVAAAGLVAAGYGLVSRGEVALWLGFAATLLGTGTAAVFTPTTAQRRANPEATLAALQAEAQDVEAGRVRRKFER